MTVHLESYLPKIPLPTQMEQSITHYPTNHHLHTGTYQPFQGETDCKVCPEGYFCQKNSSVPELCSPYGYCPEGSGAPILCPNGTYTQDDVYGLVQEEECQDCPGGKINFSFAFYFLNVYLRRFNTLLGPLDHFF